MKLLNAGQLALALKLPRDWLKSEALAGRIPCLRVGRQLRFNLEAVEKALAERAGKPDEGTP
jgi:excisionase family DNA binding protein